MGQKQISRKEFFTKTLTGIAGIKFVSDKLAGSIPSVPEFRSLGESGLMATPLCFGASRTSEESLIVYALEKGINFIDTGRVYGNGNNERIVGRVISGARNDVIIQSKLRLEKNELLSKGKGRKGAGEIRDILSSKLEASLKALNTDYIDVLLYHDAVDEDLLFHPEVMKFFSGIKRSGVIKAHGYSAHNEYMNLHDKNNSELFYDLIMVPFNHKGSFVHSLNGRYSEWDQKRLISILTESKNKGIGVIAMKTCSGGKYSPSQDIEPCYKEAVLWVLQHSFISSAAVAMANFEEVDEHSSWLKDKITE